jgi:hypothetical protein
LPINAINLIELNYKLGNYRLNILPRTAS